MEIGGFTFGRTKKEAQFCKHGEDPRVCEKCRLTFDEAAEEAATLKSFKVLEQAFGNQGVSYDKVERKMEQEMGKIAEKNVIGVQETMNMGNLKEAGEFIGAIENQMLLLQKHLDKVQANPIKTISEYKHMSEEELSQSGLMWRPRKNNEQDAVDWAAERKNKA